MTLEQAIVTVVVALIGAAGGILAERARHKRERERELSTSTTAIETKRLELEAQKRIEVDNAARDIRDFLAKQVAELNTAIDRIEVTRADEREKWHQMIVALSTKNLELSTKNLELELQHRRDEARIQEVMEESQQVEDELKTVKTRLLECTQQGIILKAHLDQCQRDYEALRKETSAIKLL